MISVDGWAHACHQTSLIHPERPSTVVSASAADSSSDIDLPTRPVKNVDSPTGFEWRPICTACSQYLRFPCWGKSESPHARLPLPRAPTMAEPHKIPNTAFGPRDSVHNLPLLVSLDCLFESGDDGHTHDARCSGRRFSPWHSLRRVAQSSGFTARSLSSRGSTLWSAQGRFPRRMSIKSLAELVQHEPSRC